MILCVKNGKMVVAMAVGTYPLRLLSGLDLVLKDFLLCACCKQEFDFYFMFGIRRLCN